MRIPITDCRLWSPEDPFLYKLEVDSGERPYQRPGSGCASSGSIPRSGRAMLNGRPYFMRGQQHHALPLLRGRRMQGPVPGTRTGCAALHQRVKEMHWNCLRYCIGFPPEKWYDIADELGILIQDEFPLWHGGNGWSTWPPALKRDELAREYAEWMRERWNHPCVVVWDASNETSSPETAPAVAKVRGLDLSSRPWDNSYMPPQEPGDSFESHPYHFQNPQFRFSDLATADPVPQGNPNRQRRPPRRDHQRVRLALAEPRRHADDAHSRPLHEPAGQRVRPPSSGASFTRGTRPRRRNSGAAIARRPP